jgi:catechol 2,3-dioxygenase-like lactoylglutathione lyase family enzyme
MGHLHLIVRDLEASKTFWVTLGATPTKLGPNDVMKFPGMLVLLRRGEPTGDGAGSVVSGIAFRVPNTQAALERWKAAGLRTEPGNRPQQGFVVTAEELRIEILEDDALKEPIAPDHLTFQVPADAVPEIQAWYAKTFGATRGKRGTTDTDAVPGVLLEFSKSADGAAAAPTRGRSIDHIGFEVKDLEGFCKKLEASGIKFDRAYTRSATGLLVANITDPWGTYIELTEGLDKL